jgi:hypothetical protein
MRILSLLFLFLIFTIPNSFTVLKYIVIPVYLFCYLIYSKNNKINPFRIHKYVIYFVFFNLFFLFLGVLNGANQKAIVDNFKLLIIFPILANIILVAFSQFLSLYDFVKISLISMFIISIFGFLLFLGIVLNFQFLPDKLLLNLNIVNDASSGSFRLNFIGLNSLFMLFPISLSVFFINNNKLNFKLFYYFIIIFTFFVILLTGRRALAIISLLSPFLLLSYAFFYNMINLRKIIFILFLLFSVSVCIFSYFYYLQSSFTGSDMDLIQRINDEFSDESVRVNQLPFLLDYFLHHPWGSGFGVILPNSEPHIRDSVSKWNFELTYLQLICNTGILGILFYPLLFIFLFKKLHKFLLAKTDISIITSSSINGLQLFLLASFSNPYISSFESIFLIFLPLFFIYNHKYFKY